MRGHKGEGSNEGFEKEEKSISELSQLPFLIWNSGITPNSKQSARTLITKRDTVILKHF